MDAEETILTYLCERSGELVAFLTDLVATPSMNPPGDERAVVARIQSQLHYLDVDRGHILAAQPERPNLIVAVEGSGPGPTLMYNGHTDTKPAGEAQRGWATDPLQPAIVGDRMYGLGTADMKGALAAMVYAAAALQRVRRHWKGRVLFVFSADEEAGSRFGARYLAAEKLVQADFGMIGEPCGVTRDWESLCVANRGVLGFRIRVQGDQGHSSLSDRLGYRSAVHKMVGLLGDMIRHFRIEAPAHPLYPQGVTHNFGVTVSGGVFYGVTPGDAEFRSDVRFPPGITADECYQQVIDYLARRSESDPPLNYAVTKEVPPEGFDYTHLEVDPSATFVKVLAEVGTHVLGSPVPLGGFSGGTDAPFWHGLGGIPTIPAFGPGLLPVCHGPNEFVSLEAVRQAAKIYALAAYRWLSAGRG